MTNNTESQTIISRLLQQKQSWSDTVVSPDREENAAMYRVIDTRYKVYILLLILGIVVVLQYLFFPLLDKQQVLQNTLQDIVIELQNFESKRLQYLQEADLYKKVQQQEQQIISCYNSKIACDSLDPVIQKYMDVVIPFLKLSNLSDPVMAVDEQAILRSVNDFLTRRFPNSSNDREKNGAVSSIIIGDPEVFADWLERVPVRVTINFSDKDGLLSFIRNVESTIAADTTYRVYYVIDKIDYDVVNYDQQQDTVIQMSAFYYTQ